MKLKITSGSLKGRILSVQEFSTTRPTAEKLRKSLFDILQMFEPKGVFVDLCAGSGACGLEALSNGFEQAIFVDQNPKCIVSIKHSLQSLDLQQKGLCLKMDAEKALYYLEDQQITPDVVFFDPPYENISCQKKALMALSSLGSFKNSLIFFERGKHFPLPLELDSFFLVEKERSYGDSLLLQMRAKS